MTSPEPSLPARLLHMFSPYTAFVTTNGNGQQPTTEVASYTGSPGWFALWLVLLCGLAITAALWRGAEGGTRRVVGRTFVGLAVAALVCLGLAGTSGNERVMITTPDGVSRAATDADML